MGYTMKTFMRILLPLVLVVAILAGTFWYLTVYDREFTHEMIIKGARYFEKNGQHSIAAWLYDKAYVHSDNIDDVALELAEHYRTIGNYTKAELTLNRAISDGGGVNVYIALSRIYVEQNKLLDALRLVENLPEGELRTALEKKRPAAPMPDKAEGHYDSYISVNFTANGNKVYITSGDFPSVDRDYHQTPITLSTGENRFLTIAVGENGLVSPLTPYCFTVIGVVEPVVFTDAAMEKAIRQAATLPETGVVYTNELWNLRSFTLPADATNYADLKFLPFLTELHIDGAAASLDPIRSLTELTVLSIKNSTVSPQLLETITGLSGLTKLTMRSCSLTSLSGMEKLTALNYLDIGHNAIGNLAPLSGLTGLKTLYLDENAVDGQDLSALSTLTDLTYLDISYNSVNSLAHIAGLSKLTHLYASTNLLTDVYVLASLSNLTHLDISCNKISAVSMLSQCQKLKELNISTNEISDILTFSALVNLEVLDFSHNKVVTLPTWPLNCALHTINGSYNNLYSIKSLAGLESLNIVLMDYNKKVSVVNVLYDCPLLMVLSVYGTKVRDVSALLTEGSSITVYYDPT